MSDASGPLPPPIDWAAFVAELEALAEASLGNRAQGIKNVPAAADQSDAGIQLAIDQVAKMTLLFVDPVRLDDLADEMRARLAGRSGKPLPARQPAAPESIADSAEAGRDWPLLADSIADSGGCLGSTLLCAGVAVAAVFVLESLLPA